MRYVFCLILSLVAVGAQSLFELPRLLQPAFPLLFVLGWGLAFGPGQGLLACAVNGLLMDTVSAAPLGSHLLAMITASMITLLSVQELELRLTERFILIPIATLAYYVVLTVAIALTGYAISWPETVVWHWFPGVFANLLWGFPLILLLNELISRDRRVPANILGATTLPGGRV